VCWSGAVAAAEGGAWGRHCFEAAATSSSCVICSETAGLANTVVVERASRLQMFS
jgi:hypothetical protein